MNPLQRDFSFGPGAFSCKSRGSVVRTLGESTDAWTALPNVVGLPRLRVNIVAC